MISDSQKSNPLNGNNDLAEIKLIALRYLRFWPVFLLFIILGYVGARFYNKFGQVFFTTNSTILISQEKSLGSELFPGVLASGSGGVNIENEKEILTSYDLTRETIEKMDINVQYYTYDNWKFTQLYKSLPIYIEAKWDQEQITNGMFKINVIDDDKFEISVFKENFSIFNPRDPFYKTGIGSLILPKTVYSFGEPISGDVFSFTVNKVSAVPGTEIFFKLMDTPSLALEFKSKVRVNSANRSGSILYLSFISSNRRLGEDYVNNLMETYIASELSEKNRIAENTINFIERQLSGISDSLQSSENELQTYRSENQIFDLSAKGEMIFEGLRELEDQKMQLELNNKYYKMIRDNLNNNQVEDLILPSISSDVDPLLNLLISNLGELQADKDRLTTNFSEETPRVRDLNNRIQAAFQTLKEKVNSSITSSEELLVELNARIRSMEGEVNSLPETERNLLGYEREFSLNENLYIFLLETKAQAQITKAGNIPKNRVLDSARSNSGQISPSPSRNVIYGILMGIFIPFGFITLKDFFNVKIGSPKELERKLMVPLIGTLIRDEEKNSLPVLTSSRSMVAESFRSLRADMSFLSSKEEKLSLLFTSSVSGEGKTFASINMASVYALMGKKTILIGTDLRKPKIADDFNLKNDLGLSTCLSSDTSWKNVVKSTGYDNFDVILSGPIPPNPAELLLLDKFEEIINEIKKEYDIVIFDCPPVGLVSETKQLFKYADVSFFVFRQEYSNKDYVKILNDLVEKAGITKIYAIINDVHGLKKYGYSYEYTNKYGYHEGGDLSWWKRILKKIV